MSARKCSGEGGQRLSTWVSLPKPDDGAGRKALAFVAPLFLCCLFLTNRALGSDERVDQIAEVRAFIDEMVDEHGFDKTALNRLFRQSHILDDVLEAIDRPAEALPWHAYRPIFLTEKRIAEGVRFWHEHKSTLARAEADFGVAPEVIVAIIGVETLYGARQGKRRVIDSLVTLGFRFPRRAKFFRSELEQFLLLCREEGLEPLELTGSYAGAMGVPQFISSSYRRFAVDYDGDTVRDLRGSEVDAVGSVANYLGKHGWRRGAQVALPADVDGGGASALARRGIRPNTTLRTMKKSGVKLENVQDDDEQGALFALEAKEGEQFWVGLQNFYVITRYNRSTLYAMAVFELSEAIRERYKAKLG